MKSFDLSNLVFRVCKKHDFPTDIRKIFVFLREDSLLLNAINNKINKYQHVQKDLLYDLIVNAYSQEKKIFSPIFKYAIDDVIFNESLPRLCLNLHSNFSPLTSILIEKKSRFVVVSDYPDTIRRVAFNSGIRSANIKIISSNEACLLNTKKFLEKNYVVNCTIDFKGNAHGKYNLLSDSMLKLAKYLRPATLFGISFVNDFGELVYVTKNLNLDDDLEKIKQDLISFIATHNNNCQFKFYKFDYMKQKNALLKYLESFKKDKSD